MRVVILMSTYNGSEYIATQLKSIIEQTYRNWELYIRDDGSKDNTLSIIKTYEKSDNRIHVICDGLNIGPRDSFMKLLISIKADYYFFADQDDKWLRNKIELSINALKDTEDGETPLLIFTDVIPTDDNLNPDVKSLWQRYNLNPLIYDNPKIALINPIALGMTMCFNEALKIKAFPVNPNIGMHDSWLFYVALKYGKILPLKIPTVYYRQHSSNVCGIYDNKELSILQHLIEIRKVLENNFNRFRRLNRIEPISYLQYITYKLRIIFSRYLHNRFKLISINREK